MAESLLSGEISVEDALLHSDIDLTDDVRAEIARLKQDCFEAKARIKRYSRSPDGADYPRSYKTQRQAALTDLKLSRAFLELLREFDKSL